MDGTTRALIDSSMMNRRDFVRSLSAMGLGLAVTPLVAAPCRAAAKLIYYTWAGYEVRELHNAYLEKHGGAGPEFGFFSDEDEALQRLLDGYAPDIVHPCVSSVISFQYGGTLKPLEISRIAAWDRLFPQFLALADIKADGDYWHVPFDWGASSMIYRTDLVAAPMESWAILLDDRYKGKMSFPDSPDNVVAIAGLLTGAKNPMDMDDAQMKEAASVLRRVHSNMRFYWTDQSAMERAMAAGELVAAWGRAASVVNLAKQKIAVKMMNPKEGAMIWACGLSMTADGRASDADRYDFINAMLSPESGKYLIEQYGYGHSNPESFKAAAPASVAALGFTDANEFLSTGHVFTAVAPDKRRQIVELWQSIKAGG